MNSFWYRLYWATQIAADVIGTSLWGSALVNWDMVLWSHQEVFNQLIDKGIVVISILKDFLRSSQLS